MRFRTLALLAGLAAAGPAMAQNQVNTQTNTEMYGNNVNRTFMYGHPYQIELLPSEVLIAEQRSGALPSELRINAESAGPLAPFGPIQYIPLQSPLQQANHAPLPQLYNPAYVPNPAILANPTQPLPAPTQAATPDAAAPAQVPAPTPRQVQPQPLPAGQPLGQGVPTLTLRQTIGTQEGTWEYPTRRRTAAPATRPATRPSPGETSR